jgi:hypothetical protein
MWKTVEQATPKPVGELGVDREVEALATAVGVLLDLIRGEVAPGRGVQDAGG